MPNRRGFSGFAAGCICAASLVWDISLASQQHAGEGKTMKLSARNILKGKIKSVKKGPISSLIVLELAPGIEVVSTITAESSGSLKLKKGQTAYAIIKASNVMIGVDE
jgi:molybdopterin-binding protein